MIVLSNGDRRSTFPYIVELNRSDLELNRPREHVPVRHELSGRIRCLDNRRA